MSLFKRNKPPSLGPAVPYEKTVREAPSGIDDPFSPLFDARCGDSSKALANYLIGEQVQRHGQEYGKQLLDQYGIMTLQKQVKALMIRRECSADIVKRAIKLAAYRSPHPFTFKYVDSLIEEVIWQCLNN
jgi:hypothetical protein